MIGNLIKALVVSASLSLLFASVAYAQRITVNDGVFTAAQAAAGESVYDESCRTCHDMGFYAGIWEFWQGKPLLDFWFVIVAEMPTDNPGVLSDAEYTDIVAYILSQRGYPAGDTLLDRQNGLDNIDIVAP